MTLCVSQIIAFGNGNGRIDQRNTLQLRVPGGDPPLEISLRLKSNKIGVLTKMLLCSSVNDSDVA